MKLTAFATVIVVMISVGWAFLPSPPSSVPAILPSPPGVTVRVLPIPVFIPYQIGFGNVGRDDGFSGSNLGSNIGDSDQSGFPFLPVNANRPMARDLIIPATVAMVVILSAMPAMAMTMATTTTPVMPAVVVTTQPPPTTTAALTCVPNPCMNGALCMATSDDVFASCACPPNICGQFCGCVVGTGCSCT